MDVVEPLRLERAGILREKLRFGCPPLVGQQRRAGVAMKKITESNLTKPTGVDGIRKKSYQRPVLRVFGSVNFLTRGGATTVNGDGGPGMMVASSDRILKENIVRIDHHPIGFGLYLFDYRREYRERYGNVRQFGVMADEVEIVMPAAVSMGPHGHRQVDYAMLGITRPAR